MRPDAGRFDYDRAFDRNIGWVSREEQHLLRDKKVAIAGMGAVGGAHLLTLVRMGIGGFHIADFDRFDIVNFNRQVGATLSTLDQPKVEVMERMARDINPELDIRTFANGVTEENLDAFLEGVDLFVDGFDFFALDIRARTFARCSELGIPAITAAPIGLSTGYLTFMPGQMTFEEYFRLEGLSTRQQYVNFFMGLVPAGLHRSYLVDPSRLDIVGKRGPSSPAGVQLCSGVVAAEALKILVGRGTIEAAPHYHQFDAFTARWKSRRLPGGNRHPIQRRKLSIAYRLFGALPYAETSANPALLGTANRTLLEILDRARWAPSGDNAQPWRFHILDETTVEITLHVPAMAENPYEYNRGQPTLIATGGLLETMRIAAGAHGRELTYSIDSDTADLPTLTVTFDRSQTVAPDPLDRYLAVRSVDRTPYRTRPLDRETHKALINAAGPEFVMDVYETRRQRMACARMCAMATDIRLRIPETFEIHRAIIDWKQDFSTWGIPAKSIGLDRATRNVMRWALARRKRTERLNRSPGGTTLAQFQMDLLPGLRSAAYFTLTPAVDAVDEDRHAEIETALRCGAAFQRIWLTATSLGLVMQPAFAPLCFADHARADRPFTTDAKMRAKAAALARTMDESLIDSEKILCFARIGYPRSRRNQAPFAPRSIRHPLDRLIDGETIPSEAP
jgi:molybdopterin/thiamine biosynthesis adenylyltransferase/nitroreductase